MKQHDRCKCDVEIEEMSTFHQKTETNSDNIQNKNIISDNMFIMYPQCRPDFSDILRNILYDSKSASRSGIRIKIHLGIHYRNMLAPDPRGLADCCCRCFPM